MKKQTTTTYLKPDQYQQKKNFFADNGFNFMTVQSTYTNTIQIETERLIEKYIYTENVRKTHDLILMAKAKKQIKESIKKNPIPIIDRSKIIYFDYTGVIRKTIKENEIISASNVIEIDITGAYIKAALNLGLISQALYNEIVILDKRARLSILGAIALRKFVTFYDNGKPKKFDIIKNDELRNVWFYITAHIDEILKDCKFILKPNEFYFYYVDGIYIKNTPEAIIKVQEVFKQRNFDFKCKLWQKIEVVNFNKTMLLKCTNDDNIKTFQLPTKNPRAYMIDANLLNTQFKTIN